MLKKMKTQFYWWSFVVFVALAGVGFLFWPDGKQDVQYPSKSTVISREIQDRESRTWSLESLPGLNFDEALTLLGSEVERYAKQKANREPVSWSRIKGVSTHLDELHQKNLEKIAGAASYYESHSPEGRARFDGFRAEYHRRYKLLRDSLTELQEGDENADEKILSLLRESGALRSPRSVPKPEDLPRRQLYTKSREPRMTSEEWKAEKKVGEVNAAEEKCWLDDLFSVRMAQAQEWKNDLAETLEIKFTPESAPGIQELLDSEGLRGSPAKIVNWVRNNIEFVPIWGALQNSVNCQASRKGTAMDIATLTIALLRGSGIRANYQAGTVRMPIDHAKNWLGNFEDAHAAASLLASGGTAAVVQVDGNGDPVALKFEHIWVRAYVDYIPSMGAFHENGDTWIDIDASIRSYEYAPELESESLRSNIEALDSYQALQTFSDASLAACAVEETGEFICENDPDLDSSILLNDEIEDLLRYQFGSLSVAEMLGVGRPRQSNSPVLYATPGFEILVRGWEHSSLEDRDRFKVDVSLTRNGNDVLSFQSDVSAIGSSRLSLFFTPASETDRLLLSGQLPQDPEAYRPEVFHIAGIKVVPELRIVPGLNDSDMEVHTGTPLDMGTPLVLTVNYREPVLNTAPISMHIVAGELTAIGLDFLSVPPEIFDNIAAEVQVVTSKIVAEDANFAPDSFLGSLLSAAIHMWFREVDVNNTLLASGLGAVTHRYPSAGICSAKWVSDTVFGLPLDGINRGVAMDIPGDVVITISRDADTRLMAIVGIQQGFMGSGLEAMVPGQLFHFGPDDPAFFAGTTQILGLARLKGDTLALIDQSNVDDVLPGWGLAAAEVEEIRAAIDRGLVVLAHATPLEDTSTLFAGYAILDTETGSGIFRMSSTPKGTDGSDMVKCIERHQPPTSVTYNLTRAWQDAVDSDAGKYFLDRLKDNAPSVSKAVGIINGVTGTFNTQMGNYNAAYSVLGESAEPLAGLVMLFTFLDVLKELNLLSGPVGEVVSLAQKVAWQGVINVITYLIRLESMAAGIEIPTDCLDLIQI